MEDRWSVVLEDVRRRVGVGGEDGIRVGLYSDATLSKPRVICWSVKAMLCMGWIVSSASRAGAVVKVSNI